MPRERRARQIDISRKIPLIDCKNFAVSRSPIGSVVAAHRDKIMSRNPLTDPWKSSGPVLDAVKVAAGNIGPPPAGVVYYAVKTALPGERRTLPRRRTRLRSGLIFDLASIDFVDCQIYDCSKTGARLRLFSNVRVPVRIRLFDEVAKRLTDANVIWRRNREIGICFAPFARPRELKSAELARLRAGHDAARH
jgi:hypothetical protein